MWHKIFPLFAHLQASDRGNWSDDLLAGTITAILLVPQGMAYAMLAGLPPEMGLYASIVPPFVYAFFGTSRALAVGPVAVAALMVANALNNYAGGDQAAWITGAMILAAETGFFLLILGMFRLGALVSFVSHPVLAGFTTGAAVLIITSQIKHLAGIDLPRGDGLETVLAFLQHMDQTHCLTFVFSALSIALLLLGRQPLVRLLQRLGLSPRAAGMTARGAPLVIVIVATLAAAVLVPAGADGLAIVGAIPTGLPIPGLEFFRASGWIELLPSSILIALVGYVESVSVAKVLAARRRQKIDANKELTALGVTNVAAAVAGTMPVAGGFSRSIVNFDAGAQTQVAAIVTAVLVAVVALFFTAAFHYLPNAVLAAIIVVAVAQLIDLSEARSIWRYDRGDGAAWLVTAVAVLVLGIELGLIAGIAVSLATYLWRTSKPHMAVMGRVPGTHHFRNVNRHVVDTLPDTLIIRIDENLYFANTASVEEYILDHVVCCEDVKHVLLVMSAVSYVDSSALETLEHLNEDLAAAGVTLHLAEVKGPVMDRLRQTHLGQELAGQRIYLSTEHAFEALTAEP